MLSTEELEKYIHNEIRTRLGSVICKNLFFSEGTDNTHTYRFLMKKQLVF